MTTHRLTVTSVLRSALQRTKVLSVYLSLRQRSALYLKRRPHRSFRLTRRRDYARSLALPGYWKFTAYVGQVLRTHVKLFGLLALIYAVLTVALVGVTSEEAYSELTGIIRASGDEVVTGGLGAVEQASVVFLSAISGGLNAETDASQQAYAGLIGLLTWLTTVWLLRAILAGQRPRLRDGLYNAGAPIVPTFLISLVLIVQLLPLALVGLGYGAATTSGLLDGGVEAMLFWLASALLVALSLYWATSTLLALVIVTLPGMYPVQALRTAGDLVVGRRVRILLRLLWVGVLVLVVWALIMLPLIMADAWLKAAVPAVAWLPIVPLSLLILSSATVIVVATYVYLLYRKVVEDDAAPATN
jgi:hypothetical protein